MSPWRFTDGHEKGMFQQRFTPHPWNRYLGNALILLTTHVIVATLQAFVTLPAHARLMYFVSTLLLAFIFVDDLHWQLVYEEAIPPRPLQLGFLSLAVTADYYVAAIYIFRSELLAVGSAVLLGAIIVGAQWAFVRSLRVGGQRSLIELDLSIGFWDFRRKLVCSRLHGRHIDRRSIRRPP